MLSPPRQMERYKGLVNAAALDSLNQLLVDDPGSLEAQRMFDRQLARAVWRQDARLALRVWNASETARSCIEIVGHCAKLVQPAVFSEWVNSVQRAAADQEIEELQHAALHAAGRARPPAGVPAAKTRKARLWAPFGKRLTLRAFTAGGCAHTDALAKLDALAAYWAP
eukprot:3727480-Pyramimonas_sp.AAC.1